MFSTDCLNLRFIYLFHLLFCDIVPVLLELLWSLMICIVVKFGLSFVPYLYFRTKQ